MDNKILYLIQQAACLMLMPRSHVKNLGTAFDTVASHSFHTAVIAYCLARMEGLSHGAAMKSCVMALFHDLAEARTGDVDFIAKHYVEVKEEKAIKDQFAFDAFGKDLLDLTKEYEERKTLESKCAKDADSLAQLYHEWVLMWQGNQLAKKWYESDYKDRVPALWTESAKQLAYKMKDSNPNDWWWLQFLKDDLAVDKEKLLGKNENRPTN